MEEEPANSREVSMKLSKTLDDIGLDTRTVKQRRQTFLFIENIIGISIRLSWFPNANPCYIFGSQTEGSTTTGLESDIDLLVSQNPFTATEDRIAWERGEVDCLMVQEDVVPGYCRLQFWPGCGPKESRTFSQSDYLSNKNGKVFANHSFMDKCPIGDRRNGPARSFCFERPLRANTDMLLAFYSCKSWPEQARGFITRKRRHSWPDQHLIQEAVQHEIFLVSVGYKNSQTKEEEWRLSFSLAERCLMFSLSIVHIKCYVVLKMLMKTFVEPYVQKCIKSYHCKTALLYTAENTETGIWREDNLLQCITLCLEQLRTWISNEFCPHFFISNANLFEGKVTSDNRDILLTFFKDMLHRRVHALLQIKIDDVGRRLQIKLDRHPSDAPVADLPTLAKHVQVICESTKQRHINQYLNSILIENKDNSPNVLVRFVQQKIAFLRPLILKNNNPDKHTRQAARIYIDFFSCWLGSVLASNSLSIKKKITQRAARLLDKTSIYNIALSLKYASALHGGSKLRKGMAILLRLENHFLKLYNQIQCICECYKTNELLHYNPGFDETLYHTKSRRSRARLFANCVKFSPQEVYCIPYGLRHELHRFAGIDIQHNAPSKEGWMHLAVVDCLPYLYYLQYLTYRQLGKRDLQQRSVQNLETCIREDNNFRHIETAWNLLGHCKELEGNPHAAITCYVTSLAKRPKHNSAYWRLTILCYNWVIELWNLLGA